MLAAARYEIRVSGSLDHRWWNWFPDFAITVEPSGETVLVGDISDRRKLLGAL
jgi:hypothetical protein